MQHETNGSTTEAFLYSGIFSPLRFSDMDTAVKKCQDVLNRLPSMEETPGGMH